MSDRIKIYRIRDFIRLNESGKLDVDRSIKLVRELSAAAHFHKDHHILTDLRDAAVQTDLSNALEIVSEFVKLREYFQNKIAVLIPNTEERLEKAKHFRELMDAQGFQFKQFTSFEEAMEWLAD